MRIHAVVGAMICFWAGMAWGSTHPVHRITVRAYIPPKPAFSVIRYTPNFFLDNTAKRPIAMLDFHLKSNSKGVHIDHTDIFNKTTGDTVACRVFYNAISTANSGVLPLHIRRHDTLEQRIAFSIQCPSSMPNQGGHYTGNIVVTELL